MDNVPSSTDNDVEVFSPARQWPKLPDVEDCDQIELHVEPTLLTYRFPGIDEPGLFNNKEMLQLKSWKTVTVRDTNDIGHIALQIQSRPYMWSPHVLTNLTTLDKG